MERRVKENNENEGKKGNENHFNERDWNEGVGDVLHDLEGEKGKERKGEMTRNSKMKEKCKRKKNWIERLGNERHGKEWTLQNKEDRTGKEMKREERNDNKWW